METENIDYIKTIKKLKRKIYILEAIIVLFIVAVIVGTISAYYYTKPYIQKFNELAVNFQNIQPAINQLNQLSQSAQFNQLLNSSKELQSAMSTLNTLSKNLTSIENTTNTIKNNLQGFTNLFK
jgi:predicted PurR-regulated permease PerM